MNVSFLLDSEATQNGSTLFVIIGVLAVIALYFALAYIRNRLEKKKCAAQAAAILETDESEEVAAITAVIALILEDEAKQEGREAPAFRVVSFKRTNNRRIG